MKKILLIVTLFFSVLAVNADILVLESDVNMNNFWDKSGKEAEKVGIVGRKLIHTNNLKRAPIFVENSWKNVNASTASVDKSITITKGMLPYLDNDDELAFVLGHELAHAQELYDGMWKTIAINFNSKKYEYKSDINALDYMVNAGYNPIAGITIGNKIFGEPTWDWGFFYTHPKGSARLMKMYEHIYKKYPQYLNSQMAQSDNFHDFMKQKEKEINAFKQAQQKKRNINSI